VHTPLHAIIVPGQLPPVPLLVVTADDDTTAEDDDDEEEDEELDVAPPLAVPLPPWPVPPPPPVPWPPAPPVELPLLPFVLVLAVLPAVPAISLRLGKQLTATIAGTVPIIRARVSRSRRSRDRGPKKSI
jgi:hypothetical protein